MALFDHLCPDPAYNTAAVVRRTGVPADTFRAWERRHGLPCPTRTETHQRLYSDRDIALITWLRDQTRAGLTIRQAVARYHAQEAPGAPRAPEALADPGRKTGLCDEVITAFVNFDTGFVLSKLGALFHLSQPGVGRRPLVAACLEGEEHEVGLLLTCLFLSRRGFRVVYLDANLPLDDLLRTVARVQPPLVLLSASLPENAERLAEAARELRKRGRELERTTGVRCPEIGYGGSVFLRQPELRSAIAGVFLGGDAAEAVATVEAVLADRPN
ncbi:MAG: MerR family transcriptional regulator [Chloroflexota bacterium]|nr:MerR family transcriptional regulator [Chloroflexota bacterium]